MNRQQHYRRLDILAVLAGSATIVLAVLGVVAVSQDWAMADRPG